MRVERITYEQTKPFILEIHYARRMPCIQYAYGLFDESNTLIGCVTYGQPASPSLCVGVAGPENRKRVVELNRLVVVSEHKNLASFLIGKSLRLLPRGLIVVSYADTAWGHVGYVYQATNWIYTGATKPRTDMFSPAGHSRHHGGDRLKRQNRSAKHRYVYVTGNDKAVLNQIKYDKLPYPKGESKRYDPSKEIPRRGYEDAEAISEPVGSVLA